MNVLIAPNNFKESIDASNAALAIQKGVIKGNKGASCTLLPLSDGGEGFVKALVKALNGDIIKCNVNDPLGRSIESYFGKLNNTTAVLEMALASGLELISESEKNPLVTSSYGTGQLIKKAIDFGFTNLIIGIGGSATNDAGMGMLQALGVDFYDAHDHLITSHGANELIKIARMDLSKFKNFNSEISFTVACDVTNPLLGASGATFVYGPQKGANTQMLSELEKGVSHFHEVTKTALSCDYSTYEGAGAAGGMGYALLSYLNASLKPGFSIVAEHTGIQSLIDKSDLVITGEGKIDQQTSQGKVISRLAELCEQSGTPLIAIGGKIDQGVIIKGITEYYEISSLAENTKDAMENASFYLEQIGVELSKNYS